MPKKKLPTKIIATKRVEYETEFALFLAGENGIDTSNWAVEDVIEMLEGEISRDFGEEGYPDFEIVD